MFQQQQTLIQDLPKIQNLYEKYQLDSNKFQELTKNSQNFKVRIPLIGAFSAGKSSLINALLAQKLLAVEIDPASNLATEISFAETDQILGFKDNQFVKELSFEQLKSQDFDDLGANGHVEVKLNNPLLQSLPHLCLADLPGLDSKSEAHSQAIHHYLGRSLAYCIMVSSEEGTLKESIKNFLAELALHQAPVLVIISKSDKRSAKDIEAIKQQVKQQVQAILPPDNYLNVVAASRKNFDTVIPALQELEQRSEQRFKETVVKQSIDTIATLQQHIEVLNNQDNLDLESLKLKQTEMQEEMQHFQQKLKQEHQQINSRFNDVLSQITQHIRSRLTGETDSFANSVLHQGSDIQQQITYSVRIGMTEGMERYFKPLVEKYLHRIESELPEQLKINQNFNFEASDNDGLNTTILTGAATLLPIVLRSFPYAAVIIPIITTILGKFISVSQKEQQRAERREQARSYVQATLIPQVMAQVELNLRQILTAQLQQVEQNVQQQIDEKYQQAQLALAQLAQQLQQGEAEQEQQRAIYQQDLTTLNQVLQALNP
ncbi:dynamin family protein [Acinetobacter johnsonii]|uniref:Dynamin family protein n=1 Tax=Acinetobacter johnsonii TaxID=40214 RepID=A0AA42XGR0_ACIJO|nr:dynamin family protein [Acinetobacter johnsonii]MDH0836991.1 dynamin family protein [Acinetobacter johnsonii]MDH0840465.1 dynamin family protein [Acinetobacter johnsonii]MDH2173972.1 dynamin family protein [Acinetobacter johnsonii]MDH2177203.1 dynamin family protein [Acinetobacter johnsonii]QPF36430.1 dynamin family protein [Acinetobacter johnsonii]